MPSIDKWLYAYPPTGIQGHLRKVGVVAEVETTLPQVAADWFGWLGEGFVCP